MPAKVIDYSKTIIYKIVCNDLAITDLYVGSTTHFTRRKNEHKCRCNGGTKKSEYKIYQTIRNNGGWLNWTIVQIEEFPCANGNEARARERYWIEELSAKLNIVIPTRSKSEWEMEYYKQNKNTKLKEWRELNKDKIKEVKKKYQEDNKDKLKEHKKEYMASHKDDKKEYDKKYRDLNKDKIRERRSQTYTCECGITCKFGNRLGHFKSLKHLSFIAQKDNIIEN